MKDYIRLKVDAIQEFTINVFSKLGVPLEDAKIVADVLVNADQRGVSSHCLVRLSSHISRPAAATKHEFLERPI